jgi:erythrin-vacuolar iron transport family protein
MVEPLEGRSVEESALLSPWMNADERALVLRVVQTGIVGFIDGTVSTLAPMFTAAYVSGSHTALVVGLATAIGAGISMALSEGLSDTGEQTGRGSPLVRGSIIGFMTSSGARCTRSPS